MVVTGAGPGIMEAGIEGAGPENAFGVSIELPFEATTSQFIDGDPKLMNFRYFFTRKLEFIKESDAFVLLPGGFGTLDEAFELLTLLQTGKAQSAPVVLLDVPGGTYWQHWGAFVNEQLEQPRYISAEDDRLVRITDYIDDAVDEVLGFYSNYHSLRFVHGLLVLRMRTAPTADMLSALNRDFADIIVRGEHEVIPATAAEIDRRRSRRPGRVAFRFDRHGLGPSPDVDRPPERSIHPVSQVTYDFGGRVAIVTGGAAGIGQASALAFARAGASVVVADVDEPAGHETVSMARAAGGNARFVATDVSSSGSVQEMVEFAIGAYGRLDYAHNNAGVAGAQHDVADLPETEWDRVQQVMLRGVYLSMKYELPHLLATGGAIVNTASGAGLVGYPGQSPYVSSKHGVLGLTKAAALEYGHRGVRVNAVCPGTVLTPMVERAVATPGLEAQLVALHPIGRIGTPEEIANAVLWLCSDDASFVLGHALAVDGGYVVP